MRYFCEKILSFTTLNLSAPPLYILVSSLYFTKMCPSVNVYFCHIPAPLDANLCLVRQEFPALVQRIFRYIPALVQSIFRYIPTELAPVANGFPSPANCTLQVVSRISFADFRGVRRRGASRVVQSSGKCCRRLQALEPCAT